MQMGALMVQHSGSMSGRRMTQRLVIATGALLLFIGTSGAEGLKIGFISTFSGPSALLGQDTLDGFNLGVKSVGGTLGGRAVDLIQGDDQLKPDVARQLADKMVERDHIDVLTGIIWSNVMLAIAKPVLDAGVFILSPNAGPSQFAGAQCHPLYFAVAFQNDTPNEAMGMYMQQKGISGVYLIAPNYPAGKDMLRGFKRYYKGEVTGEVYTQLGQLDYAPEFAQMRAKKPKALYYFISGGPGINFAKQFDQSGMKKDVPMFAPGFSLDQTILPAVGDAALGATTSIFWAPDFDNEANKKFVQTFVSEFKRTPSPYAAQGYDTARLLDAALKLTDGRTSDKSALTRALEAARFDSVRGKFKFAKNHYPIQDFYLAKITPGSDGTPQVTTKEAIVRDHVDSYVSECRMAP